MTRPLAAISVLSAAGLAIVIAPAVVPDYHWVSQSVSETAAQNTPGAWVGRIAFPLLAIGVALLLPGVHSVSYTHLDVYKRQVSPMVVFRWPG